MIRVLIVEDSPVAARMVSHVLASDPDIEIAGVAADGVEALEWIERDRPDIVTMDIHMPRMDGLEATRRLMATHPLPIVIVSSSWQPREAALTFKALEAGAVALAEKPRGLGNPDAPRIARALVQTVKAMTAVQVVRRRFSAIQAPPAKPPSPHRHRPLAVAIGASTGGPPVLRTILAGLPADFPAPVLIVQHIAEGFLHGLAAWLTEEAGFPTSIAIDGEPALPGRAYLAPDATHLGIDPRFRIALAHTPPEGNLRPAVSALFRSTLAVCRQACAGVLLTGMGRDGAAELRAMFDSGAFTIAQDEASSVVHGMPGEAIRLGAAHRVLPPLQIAPTLVQLSTGLHA